MGKITKRGYIYSGISIQLRRNGPRIGVQIREDSRQLQQSNNSTSVRIAAVRQALEWGEIELVYNRLLKAKRCIFYTVASPKAS